MRSGLAGAICKAPGISSYSFLFLPSLLPKMITEGAICAQRVKCGKAGCKCSRGDLHGPYFYRFTREGGRLRKRYVRKAEAAAALAGQKEARDLKSLLGPASRRDRRQPLLDRMLSKMGKIW